MTERDLLCIRQVLHNGTCGDHAGREILDPHSLQCRHMKMLKQTLSATVFIEIIRLHRIDHHIQTVFQIRKIYSAYRKGIVTDDLTRMILHDLIDQLFIILNLRQIIISGCDIRNGNSDPALKIRNAHQIIVPCFIHGLRI